MGILKVKIGERWVGDGEACFVVAEAGANHNRNLAVGKELIDVAAEAGADAVKFQTYSAETLYSKKTPKCLAQGRECGSARLDFAGGEAEVSIYLAPEYRGCGVGPAALELAVMAFGELELGRLVAQVKADNAASLAAFERAGFTRVADGATVTLARARGEQR